jgi:uncharacterized Ntn-hydrolase superfamily protein
MSRFPFELRSTHFVAALALLLASLVTRGGHAADGATRASPQDPRRPVHTYSIVARDPGTGEMGVAVQSHWFSVGPSVAWAEAGVGAVATQSFVLPAYGPRGLALMKSGVSAPDALAALVGADEGEAVRQVAFVDAKGRTAAHTGSKCIAFASQITGTGYSVQANMMLEDTVVPAMARAYESTRGDLTERLLAALEAAQAEGGDIRGRQSAAIVVVAARSTGQAWTDRVVDLRVEDHREPVRELRRLVKLHRAYEHMNRGDVALENDDKRAALKHYAAASKLAPDSLEVTYWHALTLAQNGKLDKALPMFREVFAKDPSWAELTKRLQAPGIIASDEKGTALVQKIIEQAPK